MSEREEMRRIFGFHPLSPDRLRPRVCEERDHKYEAGAYQVCRRCGGQWSGIPTEGREPNQ